MALTLEQETALTEILDDCQDASLTAWETQFIADVAARYEEQGASLVVTGKMWVQLRRIHEKVCEA